MQESWSNYLARVLAARDNRIKAAANAGHDQSDFRGEALRVNEAANGVGKHSDARLIAKVRATVERHRKQEAESLTDGVEKVAISIVIQGADGRVSCHGGFFQVGDLEGDWYALAKYLASSGRVGG